MTLQFFTLGLQRTEPDPLVQNALLATGVLMVGSELLAFGAAALLPRQLLRNARLRLMLLGLALLTFEAITLYVTQVAIVCTAQASNQAQRTRIEALRAAIASQRATLASLRETAARDATSRHAWTRNAGVQVARQVLEAENRIATQVNELSALEAAAAPTLVDTLGERGMIWYAVARSLLLVLVGVALFGVAGALLRARRSLADSAGVDDIQPTAVQDSTDRNLGVTCEVDATAMLQQWPAAPAQTELVFATVSHSTLQVATMTAPGAAVVDGCFTRVRAAILAGSLKPSLRAIWQAERASQPVAAPYLSAMEAAGELQRHGQGYCLVSMQPRQSCQTK